MKIAIFSETIDRTNGHGNITYELCMALHEQKIDFTLLLPTEEPVFEAYPFPVRRELPPYIFRVKTPKVLPHLFGTVDLKGFDILHCLFAFPHAFFAARMARRYHLPLIVGGQGTFAVLPLTYPIERRMLLYAYRQAKAILMPSEFTKRQTLKYASETLPIEIVHNGVNYERFAAIAPELPALTTAYSGKRVLLTVGGLKRRKGQDLIIRALPEILKRHPDVLYVLVGSGDKRELFENLAKEVGVADHIQFVGTKTGTELVAYFQSAELYVHTPRVNNLNFEGFGVVYLEAGAAGKAVVATDAGGIRDAVLDGKTGLVANDEDVAGIATAVNKLLDDVAFTRSLSEAGRVYAKEHDWPRIAELYIAQYRRLLS